jgi:hypothetical protein
MTQNATTICFNVEEWIRESLREGETLEVIFKVDESWNPIGRYVRFELKKFGEAAKAITFRIDFIEGGMISEGLLKREVWYLLGKLRGLS